MLGASLVTCHSPSPKHLERWAPLCPRAQLDARKFPPPPTEHVLVVCWYPIHLLQVQIPLLPQNWGHLACNSSMTVPVVARRVLVFTIWFCLHLGVGWGVSQDHTEDGHTQHRKGNPWQQQRPNTPVIIVLIQQVHKNSPKGRSQQPVLCQSSPQRHKIHPNRNNGGEGGRSGGSRAFLAPILLSFHPCREQLTTEKIKSRFPPLCKQTEGS
ncbi:NF-X1-type zinc finger protein NFXL1 [Platysternon megacephalum]|uniref:NF-X1-type zinc finger protein NFXL1 n=1 Tax=Platysternon megacephalum TaxID=55544 RepID=A0A4D9F6X8_9SAUR|nr:NF-X1-type zinc finger protein NFXL1 [Platysternon megacephalum]